MKSRRLRSTKLSATTKLVQTLRGEKQSFTCLLAGRFNPDPLENRQFLVGAVTGWFSCH